MFLRQKRRRNAPRRYKRRLMKKYMFFVDYLLVYAALSIRLSSSAFVSYLQITCNFPYFFM